VYVLIDLVHDFDAPIMNLSIVKIRGIPEPISLITGARFAVGANTNSIYSYGIYLQ